MTLDQSRPIKTRSVRGALFGLASAALFGASAPLAKLLLPRVKPLQFAAILYLGAGIGLTIVGALPWHRSVAPGQRLRRDDIWLIVGIVVSGGIVGPVLMLIGLQSVSGLAGALLLNLEAVFTMAIAIVLFNDSLRRMEIIGAAMIVGGAILVSYDPAGRWSATPLGAVSIAAACLAWGIDNNLTQRVSAKDPVRIVQIKTVSAGIVNLGLSFAIGQRAGVDVVGPALCLGFFSYGLSIVFDVLALRYLGAAREAAFFAAAPFIGAAVAIPVLGDPLRGLDAAAGLLMAAGVSVMIAAGRARA